MILDNFVLILSARDGSCLIYYEKKRNFCIRIGDQGLTQVERPLFVDGVDNI